MAFGGDWVWDVPPPGCLVTLNHTYLRRARNLVILDDFRSIFHENTLILRIRYRHPRAFRAATPPPRRRRGLSPPPPTVLLLVFQKIERYRPPSNLNYGSSESAWNSLTYLPRNFPWGGYGRSSKIPKVKNQVQVFFVRAALRYIKIKISTYLWVVFQKTDELHGDREQTK